MDIAIRYPYKTLEDFLTSHTLTVDVEFDDGWGAGFPVKGIELEATILFADISGFTRRTSEMNGIETLIFVNNFFSWITAEGIRGMNCIVDKYIGDEVMLLFSKRFGSKDPFEEAIQAAHLMCDRDALAFCPHIGIASGTVFAGYVGTPMKYSASVFGQAVNLAARCASVQPKERFISSSVTFPAAEWNERDLDAVIPPRIYKHPEDGEIKQPHTWRLEEPRPVTMKGYGDIMIRELYNGAAHFPGQSAEERARECFRQIKTNGRYRKP